MTTREIIKKTSVVVMSSINRVILGITTWHLESLYVLEMPAH